MADQPTSTYGHLMQTHPDYKGRLWERLSALYLGGADGAEAVADAALHQLDAHGESATMFAERKRSTAYINYFAGVIDYFGAELFTHTVSVAPGEDNKGATPDMAAYDTFAEDATGSGDDLQQLIAGVTVDALVHGKGLVGIDFPSREGFEPQSKADEEEMGLGKPRAFHIHPEALLDWKLDEKGGFAFAVLYEQLVERASFETVRADIMHRWKVWDLVNEGKGPRARFREFLLEQKETKASKGPNQNAQAKLVAEGITSFGRVPITRLELKPYLWIGNRVANMAVEHYQRRSVLISSQNKSLYEIPVLKLGSEMGAPRRPMPAEVQQKPGRGSDPVGKFQSKGWVKIGSDDSLEFASPSGKAYEIVDKQLDRLVDEIHRIAHQVAQSVSATSSALGRSGISKREDRNATEVVLDALGETVSQAIVRVYDTIAEARGEDVFWTARGLSNYRINEERKPIVEEAKGVQDLEIPSPTFKKKSLTRTAIRILGDAATPEDATAIEEEIAAAVDAEEAEPEPAVPTIPPAPIMPSGVAPVAGPPEPPDGQ